MEIRHLIQQTIKFLAILLSFATVYSCSEQSSAPVTPEGYWYGEVLAKDNGGMKDRKFVSLRMPNGHFITKQVFDVDGEPSWAIAYGFWSVQDENYIVNLVGYYNPDEAYFYKKCKINKHEYMIIKSTPSEFIYRNNENNVLYKNKKLDDETGLGELNVEDDPYKDMYTELLKFEKQCKDKIH